MDDLLEIIGAFGIGGLVSSYLTFLWQRRNEDAKAKQAYKETRYKCVVLLMKALLEFEKCKETLISHGYKISNEKDLIDLLRDEQLSAFLYASQGTIKALGSFINAPNRNTLIITVIEMRKNLWKLKGALTPKDLA